MYELFDGVSWGVDWAGEEGLGLGRRNGAAGGFDSIRKTKMLGTVADERIGLLKLFGVCCQISALTVGGGYVIIGLLQRRIVDDLKWIGREEMLDIIALAQSAPGAIAINAVNLVGWKLRGAAGAAVSILGALLPPMAIIIVVGFFYLAFRDVPIVASVLKGMTAGVAAVILDVVIGMLVTLFGGKRLVPIIICFVAFAAAFFVGVNVVFILIAAGVFGAIYGARKGGAL